MSTAFRFQLARVTVPPYVPPAVDALIEAWAERYRDAGISLLPPGHGLAKDYDANLIKLLHALVFELARVQQAIDDVRSGAYPRVGSAYLADWEDALGLPGECVTVAPASEAERAAAIVAKLRGRRGNSEADYAALAELLGFDEVSFERMPALAAGFEAGDQAYGDEWANVVRIRIFVGDQSTADTLVCMYQHQLRRAHALLDVILEGPMGAERKHYQDYIASQSLGAAITGSTVEIRYSGYLSIVMHINNGAGAAPTDTPAGTWQLQVSGDGVTWVTDADAAFTTELAKVAPNGNNLVNAVAKISNVASKYARLIYNRTSGGAVNARATAHVTTW